MKNLLIVIIGLILVSGCSKDDKNNPLSEITKEESLYNAILKATTDTIGLKLVGCGSAYSKIDTLAFILGLKNRKLWCGFYESDGKNRYREKRIWTSKNMFTDTIRIVDKGYGEYDTLKLELNNSFSQSSNSYVIDYNNFVVQTVGFSLVFISNGNMYLSNIFSSGLVIWHDGYIIQKYNEKEPDDTYWYVNTKGEEIYNTSINLINGTPINACEFIEYQEEENAFNILRKNAQTGVIVWEYKVMELGQTIDGHKPKIVHSLKIVDNTVFCTFKIINYDGTKEEKIIKLNIEDGALVDK